jgi:phage repressor protein C with HTH and peptisase S24 domain
MFEIAECATAAKLSHMELHAWIDSQLNRAGKGAAARLARALNLKPDKISKIRSGERQVKAPELRKIEHFFDEEAPMARQLVETRALSQSEEQEHHGAMRLNSLRDEIPQVAVRMARSVSKNEPTVQIPTGDGSVTAVPLLSTWKLPKNVLQRRLRGAASSIHIVEHEGDSMEPRIHDGDFVFIDTSRRAPSPPGIFALNDGFGQALKHVELIPNSDPPRVKIIPNNPKYETYERALEETRIVGRYLCRLTMD